MPFDEASYVQDFIKKLRGASVLPDDLMARYAITLPASDAEIAAQVKAVRAYWNKAYLGKSMAAQVARMCRAEDERLRAEHGPAMETRGWWQQRQSERQSAAEASIADAIVEAESVLDGSSGEGRAFFTDLTDRLGEIDPSDVPELSYLAVLLDRIGLRDESLQVLRYGCSQLASRSSPAEAELRNVEGVLAAGHGEYDRAQAAFSEASALAGSGTGLRSKITANRAIVDLWTGRIDDARTGIAAVRRDQSQPAPSVDLALAMAETEAARLTGDLEAFRKTVKALRDAAKRRIAELGSDHPHAVMITADLAAMELDLARAEGSYDRLQRVTEVLEALCCRLAAEQGAEHPRTLVALANLASAQVDLAIWEGAQQRIVQAAESLSRIAELITSVLGAEHPHSLAVGASLAAAQLKLAQVDRSADKAHDAMIAFSGTAHQISAMLGRGHPVTAQVLASVASAERSLLRRTASHLPLAEQTTSPRSASASAVRIRMLGPLQVRGEHGWHPIMAPKWRSVLAALLINANQVVSADTLIDEVWGEAVPARAANVVSIYVLRLRRLIGDTDGSLLVTQAPGYLLRIDDTVIDARLFEMMVGEGRQMLAADEPERAAGRLAEALALWQGSPLADVPRSRQVAAEAQRLADLKLDATELRITAELQCGGEPQVVPELRRLLADNPLREGLWRLLMQALVGSGRHAEAIDAYGQARAAIAKELGVDPSPELRRLNAELLAADASDVTVQEQSGLASTKVPTLTSPADSGSRAVPASQPRGEIQPQLPFAAPHPQGQPPTRDGRRHCGALEEVLWRQWDPAVPPTVNVVSAIDRLAELPSAIKQRLAGGLDAIYVGPGAVPELDNMAGLRGVPLLSGRASWDDCAGAYGDRKIVVGSPPSPSPDVMCHEIGHALDDIDSPPGRWQSDSAEFRKLHDSCLPYLISDFYRQLGGLGRREFFADAFAAIASSQRPALVEMLSGQTRAALAAMLYFRRHYGI